MKLSNSDLKRAPNKQMSNYGATSEDEDKSTDDCESMQSLAAHPLQ